MNILLVDDEESILRVIGDFLVDCGHEVTAACDGKEALSLLEQRPDIELIVSDIRMPRMNGLDFLRAVRVRFPGAPVILITGHGDEGAAVAALHEGAHDYLKKPIKFNEFLACVERVEERNRLEAQLLEDYKNLMHSAEAAACENEPAGNGQDIRAAVTSVMENLNSLDVFWRSLRSYLRERREEDASRKRRMDFILDEMPGLLSDLRRNVERVSEKTKWIGDREVSRAEDREEVDPVAI